MSEFFSCLILVIINAVLCFIKYNTYFENYEQDFFVYIVLIITLVNKNAELFHVAYEL